MNKKVAIAMAGNVALALLMTTGCYSLTAGRTAFNREKVDPYGVDSKPTIELDKTQEETTSEIIPEEITTSVVTETTIQEETISTVESSTYEAPTVQDVSPSYQKYIVPPDYENPTQGLTPSKGRPDVATSTADTTTSAKEEATASATGEDFFTYVVKSGDCLSVVANSNGVRTKELAEYNGIDPNAPIRIGQKLKIPAGRKPFTSSKTQASTKKQSIPNDGSVYVVQSGDCLSVIAQKVGVKTAELKALNNIANENSIREGQVLKLPAHAKAPAVKPETKPVVKPLVENETVNKPLLPEIKEETSIIPPPPTETDPFDLDQKTEALEATVIAPVKEKVTEAKKDAETILIPAVPLEVEEEKVEAKATESITEAIDIDAVFQDLDDDVTEVKKEIIEKFDTIKVGAGDTLELIAANNNISAEELRKLNGFDSSKKLKPGEIIKIPFQK